MSAASTSTDAARRARARTWLQADLRGSYEGLSQENKDAWRQVQRRLEAEDPDVRHLALGLRSAEFDRPLTAGEREHQQHLRERAQISPELAHEHARRILAGEPQPKAAAKPSRPAPRATPPRRRRSGSRAIELPSPTSSSLPLKIAGGILGLVLLYMALSPRGSEAFAGLVNTAMRGISLLVGPEDPLAAIAGKPPAAHEPQLPATEVSLSPRAAAQQRRNLNPRFGPAPGIPVTIGPYSANNPYPTR